MAAWSKEEVEAVIADYFDMLSFELSNRSYNKAAHRRVLLRQLRERTESSVEFKHQNISAILIELGFPYLAGYKPLYNYQALLFELVAERLKAARSLQQLAAKDADLAAEMPSVDGILSRLTTPPSARRKGKVALRPAWKYGSPRTLPAFDYVEREARNRRLGTAGEEFAIRFERARLLAARQDRLAARVEHISQTQGDGAGFDILSFEESGAERLIEVKTTKYGAHTPFFVSRNEVATSKTNFDAYHLYRIYEFRDDGRLFVLPGALTESCVLTPDSFVASVA